MRLFSRIFGAGQGSRAAEAGAPAAGPEPRASAGDVSPEVVAAISAAVAVVLDGPHRVVAVRPLGVEWSLEGRRLQLGSHQLRR